MTITKNVYVQNTPTYMATGKPVNNASLCPKCGDPFADCRCGWVQHPEDTPIPETEIDYGEPCCDGEENPDDGLEESYAMADEIVEQPKRKPNNYLGAALPAGPATSDKDVLQNIELEF